MELNTGKSGMPDEFGRGQKETDPASGSAFMLGGTQILGGSSDRQQLFVRFQDARQLFAEVLNVDALREERLGRAQ